MSFSADKFAWLHKTIGSGRLSSWEEFFLEAMVRKESDLNSLQIQKLQKIYERISGQEVRRPSPGVEGVSEDP